MGYLWTHANQPGSPKINQPGPVVSPAPVPPAGNQINPPGSGRTEDITQRVGVDDGSVSVGTGALPTQVFSSVHHECNDDVDGGCSEGLV